MRHCKLTGDRIHQESGRYPGLRYKLEPTCSAGEIANKKGRTTMALPNRYGQMDLEITYTYN